MTTFELEAVPNGLAWTKPPFRDLWPEAEPEPEPLVRRFASDTPAERRAVDALEACTRRALAQPRQP